eukprot:TRINITY_DN4367_c0_g1_i1.p1 TRINITY_DN4367_c0_g1~~TRINITY_DN4367_c0_g1_i1.p1  ORF type:complete len:255 (-),score=84.32 TRINITY_DN4367_c0_g1_i1:125-847(-)
MAAPNNNVQPPSYQEAVNTRPQLPNKPMPPVPMAFKITEEVKLYSTPREREMYDNMANLFAIIKTTEHLEKAYVRDSVQGAEYEPACKRLISQFKAAMDVAKTDVPDVPKFLREYNLNCAAAVHRLLYSGKPATIEHELVANSAKVVAETVQAFITTMDSLKLNMTAVDSVQPLLNDLLDALNRNGSLQPDFEGKIKMRNWLEILSRKKASDTLDEDQCRQLLFDLDQSYAAFHKSLTQV